MFGFTQTKPFLGLCFQRNLRLPFMQMAMAAQGRRCWGSARPGGKTRPSASRMAVWPLSTGPLSAVDVGTAHPPL